MAPNHRVLILQNLTPDGPGYLSAWLTEHGVPHDVFNSQDGHIYPRSIRGYTALACMGGEMSANDDLPSLRQAEKLILEAMDADIPVIGHCLGGQLMARALGAKVGKSPKPEIGWRPMRMIPSPDTTNWFGDAAEFTV